MSDYVWSSDGEVDLWDSEIGLESPSVCVESPDDVAECEYTDDEAFALQLLLTTLGEHSGQCVCLLTIVAKALADPAVGREALASTVADWLYAEHGTVAAAAFDLLAGIACRTPVSEADTVEVLLSHPASADSRSVH